MKSQDSMQPVDLKIETSKEVTMKPVNNPAKVPDELSVDFIDPQSDDNMKSLIPAGLPEDASF